MKLHCCKCQKGTCQYGCSHDKCQLCWKTLNCVELQYKYWFADIKNCKNKCKIQGKVKCKCNPYKKYWKC